MPHRYWRLIFNTTDGGGAFAGQQCQFRTSHGGANAATGGTAAASSTFSGTSVTNLFANSGIWSSTGNGASTPEWVSYDFGSGVTIVEVLWESRNDSFYNQAPRAFVCQYSDDNTNWSDAFWGTNAGWTIGESVVFTEPAAYDGVATYGWWGLGFTLADASAPGNAFGLAEVQNRATMGGSSQNSGGTASATNAFSGTPASQAYDGNASTFWSSNSYKTIGTVLSYAFASPVACVEVAVIARNDSDYDQAPLAADVLYSSDGIGWGIAWQATFSAWTSGETQTTDFGGGGGTETGTISQTFGQFIQAAAGATYHEGGPISQTLGQFSQAGNLFDASAETGLRQFWTFGG